MIDITSIDDDLGLFDTQTAQAANILSVQEGSLEYAPDLGVDLKYFLSEDFRFQNESFKAYLIQRLANYGINVASVADVVEALHRNYTFEIVPTETEGGMVAR
jgi:hypothetical protein